MNKYAYINIKKFDNKGHELDNQSIPPMHKRFTRYLSYQYATNT